MSHLKLHNPLQLPPWSSFCTPLMYTGSIPKKLVTLPSGRMVTLMFQSSQKCKSAWCCRSNFRKLAAARYGWHFVSCTCQWPTAASSGTAAQHSIYLPFLPTALARQNLICYLNLPLFLPLLWLSSSGMGTAQCPAALQCLCCLRELALSSLWARCCGFAGCTTWHPPGKKKSNNFLLVLQADSP